MDTEEKVTFSICSFDSAGERFYIGRRPSNGKARGKMPKNGKARGKEEVKEEMTKRMIDLILDWASRVYNMSSENVVVSRIGGLLCLLYCVNVREREHKIRAIEVLI